MSEINLEGEELYKTFQALSASIKKAKEKSTEIGTDLLFTAEELDDLGKAFQASVTRQNEYVSVKNAKNRHRKHKKRRNKKSQAQTDNERGMRKFIKSWEPKLAPLFVKLDVKYVSEFSLFFAAVYLYSKFKMMWK